MREPIHVVPRLGRHPLQVGAQRRCARARREMIRQQLGPGLEVRGLRRLLAVGNEIVASRLPG
jgi:hypothetical protein